MNCFLSMTHLDLYSFSFDYSSDLCARVFLKVFSVIVRPPSVCQNHPSNISAGEGERDSKEVDRQIGLKRLKTIVNES